MSLSLVDLTGTLPTNPFAQPWHQRTLAQITRLAIHHAASSETATVEDLNRLHHARGWFRLSYHFCVSRDGQIFKINKATDITHTVAQGNTPTLSICLLGNRDILEPPPSQWASVILLAQAVIPAYRLTAVYGHKEVPTSPKQRTVCPGRYVNCDALRAAVSTQIALALALRDDTL